MTIVGVRRADMLTRNIRIKSIGLGSEVIIKKMLAT